MTEVKKGLSYVAAGLLAAGLAAGVSGCSNTVAGLHCPEDFKGRNACKSGDLKDMGVQEDMVKEVKKTMHRKVRHHRRHRSHR